ncbi:hypothetical protein [Terrisporobacter mayombei]|uniref:DUF3784 domain-containing protein n=1 Tax=Terrisporobacter mayombei TaxID=1541 RepID=A0ABY9PYT9_9FIRM|nr:hypothetical protein [Terrisporobacter mayombei]MCC3867962.1 hypothetical protein [Terrisporobacter mayombei]WMT80096.1 hypothetical protein TEMA_04080 [Terrisporobacter mayombei]
MIGFIIWILGGIAFIVLGIYNYNSKKIVPFGFGQIQKLQVRKEQFNNGLLY